MMRPSVTALILLLSCLLVLPSAAQDEETPIFLDWQEGPTTGSLSSLAQIELPEGYMFLDGEGTQTLLQLMENPVSGLELGTVTSTSEESNWFAFFEFSDIGYVKDDDHADIDANAILESIKEGTKNANKERRDRGWAELDIVGWKTAPRYNRETRNLQWAVLAESEGEQILNYNTRILGRRGVMEVGLVCGPEEFDAALAEFSSLLGGFSYTEGNRYAEWVQGDKMAQYGLTALMVGGGAALAAKSGLLAKAWKFILFGVIAIGGFFRRLFKRSKPEPA